jgi:hypothetical protein
MGLIIGLSSSAGLSIGGVCSEGCWTWYLYIYLSLCMLHIVHQRSGIDNVPVQTEVPLSACSEVKDVEFLSPIQERHFQFSPVCGNQPRVHPQARPIPSLHYSISTTVTTKMFTPLRTVIRPTARLVQSQAKLQVAKPMAIRFVSTSQSSPFSA